MKNAIRSEVCDVRIPCMELKNYDRLKNNSPNFNECNRPESKKCAYKSNFQVPNNWQSTNANNEKVQWCEAQCGMKWKTETFALNSKLTFVSMSKRLILHAQREREIEEDRGRFTCHVSYTSVTLSVCFVCFVWLWIAFEQAENGNEFVRKNRFVFVSFTHGPFIV